MPVESKPEGFDWVVFLVKNAAVAVHNFSIVI